MAELQQLSTRPGESGPGIGVVTTVDKESYLFPTP